MELLLHRKRDEMSDESEQDQENEDQAPSEEQSDRDAKALQGGKVHPLTTVFATGMVVLHARKFRRNLLFAVTLAMLVMVLVGSVLLGEALARRPFVFTIYWAVCFLLLFCVLALALYDLMRVRVEHQAEMRLLDARMSAEMKKLRAEALEGAAREGSAGTSAANGDGKQEVAVDDLRNQRRDHETAMGIDEEGDEK